MEKMHLNISISFCEEKAIERKLGLVTKDQNSNFLTSTKFSPAYHFPHSMPM